MIIDYDVVFKLPCEKTFTFNISVSADDYDPTTEVGNHPSQHITSKTIKNVKFG